MRFLLVLLGLVVLVVAVLMFFGFINLDQTRPLVVQAPQFKADVGRIDVGTQNRTVAVPTVSVQKPGETPPAQ